MKHDLSTYAGQIANIKAVRARIAAAAYKPPFPTPRIVSSSNWTRRPLWMSDDIHFDWHVMAFKRVMATAAHIRWLKRRCRQLGCDYDDIRSESRRDEIIPFRQRLYYEMHKEFPDLPWVRIGQAMGRSDHSAAIWGAAKYEAGLK